MTAGGGADPQRGWFEPGQAAFAAWLLGTVLGLAELYSLAAGQLAAPSWLALTSAGLLLLAGALAAAWQRSAQAASTGPPLGTKPLTTLCAALFSASAGACALLAGRMAHAATGDGALFILASGLAFTLVGTLGALAFSASPERSAAPGQGPSKSPSIAEFLRRLSLAGLCLSGFFLAAWILGGGQHRPALPLALLPVVGLLIGLLPEATARGLRGLGARFASGARAFGGPPGPSSNHDPVTPPKAAKLKKGKKNPAEPAG